MNATNLKKKRRLRRRRSVRRSLARSGPVVRLSVTRSLKHISASILDESTGQTICGVGTTAKRFASDLEGKNKTDRATFVGTEIARLAKEKGVERVVFDRGHCKYHGRVKALAEAAREGGLEF
jgi:large subunit ribosomal protein L18